jgi:hypothetical protein
VASKVEGADQGLQERTSKPARSAASWISVAIERRSVSEPWLMERRKAEVMDYKNLIMSSLARGCVVELVSFTSPFRVSNVKAHW